MSANYARKMEVHAVAKWDDEEGHWIVEISSIDHIGNENGEIIRVMTNHGIFVAEICDEWVIANSLLCMNGIEADGVADLSKEQFQHFRIID